VIGWLDESRLKLPSPAAVPPSPFLKKYVCSKAWSTPPTTKAFSTPVDASTVAEADPSVKLKTWAEAIPPASATAATERERNPNVFMKAKPS
jgi:hypothetical protein